MVIRFAQVHNLVQNHIDQLVQHGVIRAHKLVVILFEFLNTDQLRVVLIVLVYEVAQLLESDALDTVIVVGVVLVGLASYQFTSRKQRFELVSRHLAKLDVSTMLAQYLGQILVLFVGF